MKKTLSLLSALMLALTINAQVFIDESFDETGLPSGWSYAGEGNNSIIVSSSNHAGGEPNEVAVVSSNQGYPDFNGYARVVSPAYDLTGVGDFLVSFKYAMELYEAFNMFEMGIAASADDGSTWFPLWRTLFDMYINGEVNETVSLPEDWDKSNVKFCVYVWGNSQHLWHACFDDICVSVQKDNDVAVTNINTADIIGIGENKVSFSVSNNGSNVVTDLTAKYQFEGYEEVSQNFSTNIDPFTSTDLTFDVPTDIQSPNDLTLTVNVTAVNNTTDDNESDNTFDKELSIAMGTAQRIPMIEHFSSSSCHPCVSVNASMKALTNDNPGKYTYVKYSTSWPSPVDTHYTPECDAKAQYYGVSGVPVIMLDGTDRGTPVSQTTLDDRYNTPAITDVRGAFNIDGNILHVTADFMSFANMSDVKAFVTVNEKVIEKNGANGESEFRHILLTMLGGVSGTDIELEAGEYQRLEFTHDMSTTKMQDINDLEVALWLQNLTTKEVFNSHFAYEYTDHCYPVQNLNLNIEDGNLSITFEAPEQGAPIGYNVYKNGILIAENTTELSHNITADDMNIISVVALYEDEMTSVPVVELDGAGIGVVETTTAENTFNIYPNPAKDFVKVSTDNGQQTTVKIYNTLGMLVETRLATSATNEIEINVSEYNPGIYFINISNEEYNVTKKIVVE